MVDAIDDDPMVNWEGEPGYVLLTMVACLNEASFCSLIESYGYNFERFEDIVRRHGNRIWVDICKVKIKKIWEEFPNLFAAMLNAVRATDPCFQMGYCTLEGSVQLVIMGNSAKDISKALARESLPLSAEHMLYIGRELQRLEDCLQHNLIYVQD